MSDAALRLLDPRRRAALRRQLRARRKIGGFSPSQISAVAGWLSVAQGTITGSGYSSIPDLLNNNPAVQGTDANRPTAGTSSNGLPIMNFATQLLAWPLQSYNNSATKLGFACWLKLANVVGNKFIVAITNTAGGASANKFLGFATGTAIRCDDQTVDRHAQSGTLDTAWHFVTMEVDCTQGTEAGQVVHTVDAVTQTVSFSSDTAWSATLGTPTGNMLIGALTTGAASPFVGSFGPNFYWLNRQLTAAERTALMNYQAPT